MSEKQRNYAPGEASSTEAVSGTFNDTMALTFFKSYLGKISLKLIYRFTPIM